MSRPIILLSLTLWACGVTKSPIQTLSSETVSNDDNLYKRLGGVEVLRVLVDEWMLEVSSEPRTRDFLVNADIAHLKLRLVERICVEVGGPCVYRGQPLQAAHAHLDLQDVNISAFLQTLDPAMERVGIEGDTAEQLRNIMKTLAVEVNPPIEPG